MDIIKNPIIIGLTMGTLTYGYLLYTIPEKKKGKKKEKESVNLMIPLVMFIISWFIAYAYFEYNNESQPDKLQLSVLPNIDNGLLPIPLPVSPKYGFVKDVLSETSDPQPYSLIATGITIPTNLPDVLLDVK
jgi:hypothetical protein